MATAASAVAQTPSSAATSDPQFRVTEVRLEGATLLAPAEWQALTAPILRRDIGFAQLEATRAAIEARYHALGWRLVSVRIPAQTPQDGVIRMQAVEPRLQAIAINGAQSQPLDRWRATLPALQEGQPPNLAALDKQITLANDNPAQRVQVAFAPGPDAATLAAEIRVEEAPASGWTAFADNTGNDQTGKLRYGLAYRHSKLFDADHQLNAQVISAPHVPDAPSRLSLLPSHRVQIFGLGYRVPLYRQGAVLDATLGHSNVDSGTVQDLFKITGRGSTAALKYTQLMDRRAGWEPRWFVGADWRHFDSQTLFGGVNLASPLRITPLSVGLSASRPATPQQPTALTAFVQLAANLPGGRDGGATAFAANRAGAKPGYRLLRFGGSASTPLGNWTLSTSLDGQYSSDLLVAGEQFSAGGGSSVRGFADRGITGDSGLRVQIEAVTPNLLQTQNDDPALRLAVFTDAAYARRNRPAALEQAHSAIASVGLGLRGNWGPAVLRLDWGKPVQQRTGAPRESGAVHVSAAIRF